MFFAENNYTLYYIHYHPSINRYMAECFGKDEHRISFENYMDVLESWADMVRTYEFE